MNRIWLLTSLLLVAGYPVDAATIKDATWNIEHLRAANGAGPNSRQDVDYERLAGYASRLDADVVALQEVAGAAAAARVLAPADYNLFFSRRNDRMLTGFAVRKGLQVTQNADLEALNVSVGLRHGTDITVEVDGQPI